MCGWIRHARLMQTTMRIQPRGGVLGAILLPRVMAPSGARWARIDKSQSQGGAWVASEITNPVQVLAPHTALLSVASTSA